jgi:hypothetical protein
MNMLNELEAAVLDKLLTGDLPALACLRAQRQRMRVTKREHTGVGFFTEFEHPDDVVRLAISKSIRFGDVLAELDGLEHGAGFLLFIDKGVITMLEGYTNANDTWPVKRGRFELRYWAPQRDLRAFQDASDPRGSEGPARAES